MMLVSVISYIDRSTLAVLIPSILRDTGMTVTQYGWIVSGFSFGYMAGNPVWGIVLDRVGLRTGMLLAVSLWDPRQRLSRPARRRHRLLPGARHPRLRRRRHLPRRAPYLRPNARPRLPRPRRRALL